VNDDCSAAHAGDLKTPSRAVENRTARGISWVAEVVTALDPLDSWNFLLFLFPSAARRLRPLTETPVQRLKRNTISRDPMTQLVVEASKRFAALRT